MEMLLLSAEQSSPQFSLAQTEGKTHEENEPSFSGFDEEEYRFFSIIDTAITAQCMHITIFFGLRKLGYDFFSSIKLQFFNSQFMSLISLLFNNLRKSHCIQKKSTQNL